MAEHAQIARIGELGIPYRDFGDFVVILQPIYKDVETGELKNRPSYHDRVGNTDNRVLVFHGRTRIERVVAEKIDGLLEKSEKAKDKK